MVRSQKVRTKKKTTVSKKKKTPTGIDELAAIPAEDELNEPSDVFTDYAICIYGESAVGKTSLIAASDSGVVTVMAEPKRRGLSIRQVELKSRTLKEMRQSREKISPWMIFQQVIINAIADNSVTALSMDSIDRIYQHCVNHFCWKNDVSDPSDMKDHGQLWREIKDEFEDTMNALIYGDKGVFFISHAVDRVLNMDGDDNDETRIEPSCAPACFRFLKAATEYAIHYGFYKGERVFRIRTGATIWTKCSTDMQGGHFMSPDGKPIKMLRAGKSPREAWERLVASFNNQLDDYVVEKNKQKSISKSSRSTKKTSRK